MWTVEDLFRLTPEEFEGVVADLWRAMGYMVRLTAGPGDAGVDVVATMDRGVPATVFIQAKCYSPTNKVGVREIREYSSLLRKPHVDTVVVVCSSGFTDQAIEEARELKVRTIDGPQLVMLLNQYDVPLPLQNGVAPSIVRVASPVAKVQGFSAGEAREDQRPRLGRPGWAIFLLLVALGGFVSLAKDGFSIEGLLFSLGSLFISLLLFGQYADLCDKVATFREKLGLTDRKARRLVAAQYRSFTDVAACRAETIALLLGCDETRARQIINRAASESSSPERPTQPGGPGLLLARQGLLKRPGPVKERILLGWRSRLRVDPKEPRQLRLHLSRRPTPQPSGHRGLMPSWWELCLGSF